MGQDIKNQSVFIHSEKYAVLFINSEKNHKLFLFAFRHCRLLINRCFICRFASVFLSRYGKTNWKNFKNIRHYIRRADYIRLYSNCSCSDFCVHFWKVNSAGIFLFHLSTVRIEIGRRNIGFKGYPWHHVAEDWHTIVFQKSRIGNWCNGLFATAKGKYPSACLGQCQYLCIQGRDWNCKLGHLWKRNILYWLWISRTRMSFSGKMGNW